MMKNFKGILTLIGGSFLHLMFGSIFLWGTINDYITSYFRINGNRFLSSELTGVIFPV